MPGWFSLRCPAPITGVLVGAVLAVQASCVVTTTADEPVASGESPVVSAQEIHRYWQRFDDENIKQSWASENGGRKWAGDYLAWQEGQRELSLVDMYLATDDPAFLDALVDRAKVVLSLRDDEIGKKDEVRGKVMKAWGRYPDVGQDQRSGVWVVEMIQNGMITYPLAALVKIAHQRPEIEKRFGKGLIDEYRHRLVETLDAFDADWDESGDEGFYRFPKGYSKVYPPFEGRYLHFNRPLALGRSMMMLADAGIDAQHRDKYQTRVRKMARFFLRRTRAGAHGSVVWDFSVFNPSLENAAHASIAAEFIALAGQRKYTGVGRNDVDEFIATFRNMTRKHDEMALDVAGHLDGGAMDQEDANQSCGRWLELAAYAPKLTQRCTWLLAHGFDTEQVGYAKTLRHRGGAK